MKIRKTTNGKNNPPPHTGPPFGYRPQSHNQIYQGAAQLWKKGATNRVNGLQMRLIPCLGSNRAVAVSENQKYNMKLMAAKQQFCVNSYMVKIDNAHIMNSDDPVKNYTLRQYLMSRAPKTSVIQRLFVSVRLLRSRRDVRTTESCSLASSLPRLHMVSR
jgi:hypothetical protein